MIWLILCFTIPIFLIYMPSNYQCLSSILCLVCLIKIFPLHQILCSRNITAFLKIFCCFVFHNLSYNAPGINFCVWHVGFFFLLWNSNWISNISWKTVLISFCSTNFVINQELWLRLWNFFFISQFVYVYRNTVLS